MADLNITQAEADKLIAMEKRAVDDKDWFFPAPGERVSIPLTSLDKRETFVLDVTRANQADKGHLPKSGQSSNHSSAPGP